MQVKELSLCSEAIYWPCGCNYQFGNVVISDSFWGDPMAESSEGLLANQDDPRMTKTILITEREMEWRLADWRMGSVSYEAKIMINLEERGSLGSGGVSGNMQELEAFHYHVFRLAYKWVNRRSQKQSFSWVQRQKLLKYNPLPQA